jgi:hypothetical protein
MSSLAPNVAGYHHALLIPPASPAPPQSSYLSSLILNVAHSHQASPFPLAPAAPTQSSNALSRMLNVAHSRYASPFPPTPGQLPDLFYGSSMSHQAAWTEQNSGTDTYGMLGGDTFLTGLLEDQTLDVVGASVSANVQGGHLTMQDASHLQIPYLSMFSIKILLSFAECELFHPKFLFLRLVSWGIYIMCSKG